MNAPDQGLYQYGGSAGYADGMRHRLIGQGQQYGARNALTGTSDADYRQGLADYRTALGQQNQTRAQQQQLAGRLSDAAQGVGPSLAGEQLKAGTEQAALNALNVAATTRGGGAGAALAAQDSNMMGAQRANRDAAMARIQEINDARGQYAGLLSGMRGQDQAAMEAGQGLAQLGMGQQQIGLQQQGLSLQQQGQNDAMVRAMLEGELAVNQGQAQGSQAYGAAQLQAALANQGAQVQSGLAAQGLNANAYDNYQNRMNAIWGGLMGAGGAMGAAAMGKP